MKKMMLLLAGVLSLFPLLGHAEDFLGAPLVPDAQVTSRTEDQVVLKTALSHDQVVAFYKGAVQGMKDIKWRDWSDVTYIEDDGSQGWHSVTISKHDAAGATVTIKKDSWSWIVGTLILRFIGVFVVLSLLWFGMSVSGAVMSRFLPKSEAKSPTA